MSYNEFERRVFALIIITVSNSIHRHRRIYAEPRKDVPIHKDGASFYIYHTRVAVNSASKELSSGAHYYHPPSRRFLVYTLPTNCLILFLRHPQPVAGQSNQPDRGSRNKISILELRFGCLSSFFSATFSRVSNQPNADSSASAKSKDGRKVSPSITKQQKSVGVT